MPGPGHSIRFIALVTLGLLADLAFSDPLKEAISAYKTSHYNQAYTRFLPLAKKGNATAQYYLAVMYANGQGVEVDYQNSATWTRRAARQGHLQAQYFLSVLYTAGLGVPKDPEKAAYWYRKYRQNRAHKNRP